MTNNVNVSDLAQLAQSMLREKTNGKDYMLSQVYAMTRQAYNRYPEDPVIRQFAFVIERMSEKRGEMDLITQAEMSSIYNDLVRLSENSKFKDVLGELLHNTGTTKTASSDNYINHNRVDADNSKLDLSDYTDQVLVGALNGAFGGSIDEQKTYSSVVAAKGAEHVAIELESLGFSPRIEILGGSQSTMVYGAHFDTKSGRVTVAIPLDTSSDKLLLPSIFVADDRFEDLTAEKLEFFIDKKAVSKNFSVPNARTILKAVGIATGQTRTAEPNELNKELEIFSEGEGDMHLSAPKLFYEQDDTEPKPYIDTTPDVEMPKELAHLAHDFENDLLEAVSGFGKDAIRKGKGIVLAELAAAGFKNSQVRFGSEGNGSVIYMASMSTPKGPVEIEVPVDMQITPDDKYTPLMPSCFAYEGLIEDFTAAKLQRFALNRPTLSSMNVVSSNEHSYMSLPELRDEIIKSASESDYVACEMILGTIQERFDSSDYMNTVADYHYLLTIKSSYGNQEKAVCTREIPAGKTSIAARCGHYGVTMDKVVVGSDGLCTLKSAIEREKLNPIKESGASISTSKVYWS